MTARLILFTRFPRAGAAKTRLIPVLGDAGAAAVHRELTEHTLSTMDQSASTFSFEAEIRYTGGSPADMAGWLGPHRLYVDQGAGALGARMERAAADAFDSGVNQVVIIGADCPELSPGILKRAFDLLIRQDVVLGPATDGGYYLVGIRQSAWERARHPLFADIPWSTADVLTETVRHAHAAGLEVARLNYLGDVDRPEDLVLWERIRGART